MNSAHSSGEDLTGHNVTQTTSPAPLTSPSQPCVDNVAETTTSASASGRSAPNAQGQSEEERAVQAAIELSVEDQKNKAHKAKQPLNTFQDDLPNELVLSLNNEFSVLDELDGDTIVYIGPPPQMPEQSDKEYQYIVNHFSQVHVVNSATLKLMGSTAKFNDDDLLGPKSIRTERKLRKLAVLAKAEEKHGARFRYHLDLRPPDEDEEAVILVTDLTCTKGVMTWHLASSKYEVSPLTVLGHDEYEIHNQIANYPKPPTAKKAKVSTAANSAPKDASLNEEAAPVAVPSIIRPDYSVIRHRSAIERLLHAICGNDPKLDSAPKVWTYFAIAKYFGCAHQERISRWIKDWIYDANNANFVQNNPEVAYRIGMGIKSPVLLQDAFSILVGERALINAFGEINPAILSPLRNSVHGRKLELLDDDERNRIDHAADVFVTRIRGVVYNLCRDMEWLRKCRGYAALDDTVGDTPEEIELLESAKHLVKEYVRSRIYYVLCQDQAAFAELEPNPESTLAFRSGTGEHYNAVYNTLNQPMRMFTKSFWLALQRTDFGAGVDSTAHEGTVGTDTDTRYIQGLRELYPYDPENGITTIPKAALVEKIKAVNRLLHSRHSRAAKIQEHQDPLGGIEGEELQSEAIPNTEDALSPGSSKHHSEDPNPSSRDASPAKRRKTLKSNDSQHTVSFAENTGTSPRSQNKSPVKSQIENVQTAYGNPPSPTPNVYQAALPYRDKEKGVVDHVKSYLQNHLAPSKAEPNEDQEHLLADVHRTADNNHAPNTNDLPHMSEINGKAEVAADADDEKHRASGSCPGNLLAETKPDAQGTSSEAETKAEPPPVSSAASPHSSDAAAAATTTTTTVMCYNPWTHIYEDWSTHSQNDKAKVTQWTDEQTTAQNKMPTNKGFIKMLDPRDYLPGKKKMSTSIKKAPAPTPIGKDLSPINPSRLLHQVGDQISNICSGMLYPPHLFHQETGLLPTNLFDNLLCLDATEFRYLPLWAPHGLDDGSGGVFDECPVPNLDPLSSKYEPFAAGRIKAPYHTHNDGDVSDAGHLETDSEFTDIATQAISTVGKASKLATDGTETVKSLATSVATSAGRDGGPGSSIVRGLRDIDIKNKDDDDYNDMDDFEWPE
ncbi:hypothetical protein A1O1_02708 [Capronia coronata CBS 617.96]|uniref:Uncharacterized protein n=1 Tax=Capronia coronata CBS 617.96 TaxID=1182541 RepID=W9ZII7_9EURO|nr:uncharacterized protein A1O1_02708 [Capronia coronata CBS 617.96]EXJ94314.1 hypothetical protein A1O1_02708 [Capronia coronata CBS 617.96]